MAKVLDGNAVAHAIQTELKADVHQLTSANDMQPGLAVILVGDDPASKVYVGRKKKVCESIGIRSFDFRLGADCREEELVSLIEDLNQRDGIHGILLQLPLPDLSLVLGMNSTDLVTAAQLISQTRINTSTALSQHLSDHRRRGATHLITVHVSSPTHGCLGRPRASPKACLAAALMKLQRSRQNSTH